MYSKFGIMLSRNKIIRRRLGPCSSSNNVYYMKYNARRRIIVRDNVCIVIYMWVVRG